MSWSIRKIKKADVVSLLIIVLGLILIIVTLLNFTHEHRIFTIVSFVGSVASTGGLLIALIQISALRKTAEATQAAIIQTAKEMTIKRVIESAANCFNQLNQIDEYLETNNFDSIKTILPIATENFHDLIFFKDFDMEKLMEERDDLGGFLEHFAGQLTIWINHRNIKNIAFELKDEELEHITLNIQKVKAFSNRYKNRLQQGIVKEG